jgi:cytochrome P450
MSTATLTDRSQFETDIDLWSDEVLLNPYDHYKTLRDIGPAAYLTKYDMWIITRYDVLKAALADWETFSSAHLGGIAFNAGTNAAWQGSTLVSDPPQHGIPRKVFDDALRPRHLRSALADVKRRSEEVVELLLAKGEFDGVKDFAQDLPLHIVMDLIGWPAEGREKMLEWAEGAFNAAGPEGNQRMLDSIPKAIGGMQYLTETVTAENIRPNSFGSVIFDAAARGELPPEFVPITLAGYLNAALDTTINAAGSLLMLFAQNPDQWDLVRADTSLVSSAFLEGVRLESPAQFFSRATTRDVDLGEGCIIPKDSKVAHSYAAANRDERHYPDPERFDVTRNPTDNLAFDFGVHACPGRTLATMEGEMLFTALAERVTTIELIGEPTREPNNITRGWASLPMRIS